MISPRCACALLLALAMTPTTTASAGTYSRVLRKIREANPLAAGNVGPYAIVHPISYTDPAGGTQLPVRVCVRPGSEALGPAVNWAICQWNELRPHYGNCFNCALWEDPAPPPGLLINLHTVVLHELGHCAVGLGHPNLEEIASGSSLSPPLAYRTGICDVDGNASCGDHLSFTASANATHASATNATRGDKDDSHVNTCSFVPALSPSFDMAELHAATPAALVTGGLTPLLNPDAGSCGLHPAGVNAACPSPSECCPPCPGPECPVVAMTVHNIAWFRRSDNDPVTISPTSAIDSTTFSRVLSSLPSGSAFPASANLQVAKELGYPNTQSVMYSGVTAGAATWGLTADDTNMLMLARSGSDRLAHTADDYTVLISRISPSPDCSAADLEVFLDPLLPPPVLGACSSDIVRAFSQGAFALHYRVTPAGANTQLQIGLNGNTTWDFSPPLVFSSFETGDFSDWNSCPN